MTKLIVGLGNPGEKYQKTRHNVGFMILDALAEKFGAEFELKKKLKSEIAKSSELILAKPLTFMNESGPAIKKLLTTYLPDRQAGNLRLGDLLIVHDEIDLPFGKIKFGSGRGAGHKGVESIIKSIGQGCKRLRVGIENRKKFRIPPTEDYVLQNFTAEEITKLKKNIIPKSIDEIKKIMFSTLPVSASPYWINQS